MRVCSAAARAPDARTPALAAAAAWDRWLLATALQATVPTTASPIEPPTCRPTLFRLEAAPVSLVYTLLRMTRDIGTNSRPRPAPRSSAGPSIPPAYVLC